MARAKEREKIGRQVSGIKCYVFSTLLASSRHFVLVKLAFGTKPQPPQNEKFKKKKKN